MNPPLTKVISTAFDSVRRLITKVKIMGNGDTRTAFSLAPYGVDSNPIAGMRAIYADTTNKKDSVIIGYINKDLLAAVGETRLFSTDENGQLKTFVWLKNDGTLQLGGDAKHAVRYEDLNSAIQSFQNFLQTELGKIATGITAGGGTYTPGTVDIDITASKNDNILMS